MDLIPAPFPSLLRRMLREHEREGKIFDLPARKFWRGPGPLDYRVRFHGRKAANPYGPAAGPQDQMAQNLVLAWLAGSRILELKTVQINDRLVLPRPCIDATAVGYNVEWSQELRLRESLREYAAGSMLIDILRHESVVALPGEGFSDTILDMSVGYDLAGIQSAPVRGWIESMKDARAEVAALRDTLTGDLARYRDVPFTTRLSDQITLSTFHGCPAAEIEGIVRFLLTEMDVDVTVKLNPTLLGRERVDGLLHDVMGYHEVMTRPDDFAHDLQWTEALAILDRLGELARGRGRTLQVKFSNTLVVRNHRAFFPASEAVMYLSGAPLHVVTLNLVDAFRRARPEIPISFSAGVDAQNAPDCAALGFTPITTCTDLLRAGGYGRLPRYLDHLGERMTAVGVRTIGDFVLASCGHGDSALRDVVGDGESLARVAAERLRAGGDLRAALVALGRGADYDRAVARAAVLNTPEIVARATKNPRYHAEANRTAPRKIGSHLVLFDCISCDKCLPVCPNDANFVYETGPLTTAYPLFVVSAGEVAAVEGGVFEAKKVHQIGTFQDFCNECGNCDVFCPEDGGPYIEKPRFFGSLAAFRALPSRDGLFGVRGDERDEVWARLSGREYRLVVHRGPGRAEFTDGTLVVDVDHTGRKPMGVRVQGSAAEGHTLDFSAYLKVALIADGVLDARKANPVNASWL